MINENFVILAAVITLLGGLTYVADTLKGTARPNRVTWFMWTLIPMVAFAAEIKQGVGLQSLITFMAGFNPLLVVVASAFNKKASWRLTAFDLSCGGLSVLGLILWLISGQGNIAIALSIIADLMAAIPTVAKSYSHPESESWINYFSVAISAGITLFTIKTWTFANYGFPLYLLIMCILLTLLVHFKLGKRLQAVLA